MPERPAQLAGLKAKWMGGCKPGHLHVSPPPDAPSPEKRNRRSGQGVRRLLETDNMCVLFHLHRARKSADLIRAGLANRDLILRWSLLRRVVVKGSAK